MPYAIFAMLTAIGFDNQPAFQTNKVDDVPTDRVLATKALAQCIAP